MPREEVFNSDESLLQRILSLETKGGTRRYNEERKTAALEEREKSEEKGGFVGFSCPMMQSSHD